MTFTYDPTTPNGRVRLLIADTSENAALYQDEDITAFLAMASDSNIFRAAALALRSMATNEIMVQKRIKLLDLSTDGPAEALQLRLLAKSYDDRADDDDLADVPFEVGEWVNDLFSFREYIWKDALRNGGV